MGSLFTVIRALEHLDTLSGMRLSVTGILFLDRDRPGISHNPQAGHQDHAESTIWLNTGSGAHGLDEPICQRWRGERIVVVGTLIACSQERGCSHPGMWPAVLLAEAVRRA